MRRLPVFAALAIVAIIAASAWLVIDARSDPDPLPTAEHLPRDDEQAQQQEQTPQPDEPDESGDEADPDQSASAQSEEPEPTDVDGDAESDDDASDDLTESDQQEETVQQEAAQGQKAEQEDETPTVSDEDLPERRLIEALDIARRPLDQSAPTERAHIVEAGDTLLGIANAYDIDIPRLITVNGLALDTVLRVGQVLQLPSMVTYVPLQTPPGPEQYVGGGLVWGTIADVERDVVHSLVVNFIDHRAGLPGAPDLVIGCISNQLVVELSWQPADMTASPADVRVYWRVDRGPLLTSRWTVANGVLSAPDPKPFIDSLRGAVDLRLYPAAPDARFQFYWYPGVGQMVETPVQPNLDHCGS